MQRQRFARAWPAADGGRASRGRPVPAAGSLGQIAAARIAAGSEPKLVCRDAPVAVGVERAQRRRRRFGLRLRDRAVLVRVERRHEGHLYLRIPATAPAPDALRRHYRPFRAPRAPDFPARRPARPSSRRGAPTLKPCRPRRRRRETGGYGAAVADPRYPALRRRPGASSESPREGSPDCRRRRAGRPVGAAARRARAVRRRRRRARRARPMPRRSRRPRSHRRRRCRGRGRPAACAAGDRRPRVPRAGRLPVAGPLQLPVAGPLQLPVVGRSPLPVAGSSPHNRSAPASAPPPSPSCRGRALVIAWPAPAGSRAANIGVRAVSHAGGTDESTGSWSSLRAILGALPPPRPAVRRLPPSDATASPCVRDRGSRRRPPRSSGGAWGEDARPESLARPPLVHLGERSLQPDDLLRQPARTVIDMDLPTAPRRSPLSASSCVRHVAR